MKEKRHYLNCWVGYLVMLICTFTLYAPVKAATIPVLSNGKYIRTYTRSEKNNTYIYTSSNLRNRGTSKPYRAYKAVIYASDELYVYKMTGQYCYVSYPTSSGRKYGYIRTSDIAYINSSESQHYSRASITTYKRPGKGKYGSISKGDWVCTLGTYGQYVQVIYPVGSYCKMGWISKDNYNKYVKPVPISESKISNGIYTFRSALNNQMVMDVSGGSKSNRANIHLWSYNGGNNQKFQVTRLSSGWYKIIDMNSKKAVDVANAKKGNEVNIQLYSWNGSDAQLWKFYSAGNNYYYIKNKLGYYIDVWNNKTADGTNIQVYQLNKGNNQKWYLQRVNANTNKSSTKLSTALYKNTNARITCGFDGYKSTSGRHEGIDFACYLNAPVYSVIDGEIINIQKGCNGSKGLSTIAIYDRSANKTVIYLHSNPGNVWVGQRITKGQQIATQGWRGCSSSSGSHTHVEVRDGRKTNAAKSLNDYKLDNPNPSSYWKSKGYTVQ